MTQSKTARISLRLDTAVNRALEVLADQAGFEVGTYIQKVLSDHALASGVMPEDDAKKLRLTNEVISEVIKHAHLRFAQGLFDEHFTLQVIRQAMTDGSLRKKYEAVVGGDAYATGLPGKSPLNMYLGWYIKNAIGAEPILDGQGNPKRVTVRGEPIQSYTLLQMATPLTKAA